MATMMEQDEYQALAAGQEERNAAARKLFGKDFDELSNTERLKVTNQMGAAANAPPNSAEGSLPMMREAAAQGEAQRVQQEFEDLGAMEGGRTEHGRETEGHGGGGQFHGGRRAGK